LAIERKTDGEEERTFYFVERVCLPMPDGDAMVAAQGQGNVRQGNEHKITGTFGGWRASHAGLRAEPGGFPEINGVRRCAAV